MDWILKIDNQILDWVAEHLHSPLGDAVMPVITVLGNAGAIWILVAVILLFLPKWREAGIQMLAAMAVAAIVGSLILKPLIARERPFSANEFTELLISAPKDFSFPSGHTSASIAAAVILLMRNRWVGIPAMILAVLIAFSRIYLYVHYPSDILGGIILGLLSAVTVRTVTLWIKKSGYPSKNVNKL